MNRLASFAAALLLAAGPAFPHGASRGLHLHLEPEPVAAGATVTVRIDSMESMLSVALGWVGGAQTVFKPKTPVRHVQLRLKVPAGVSRPVLNLHAEAVTRSGKTVRAAAVVRISGTATETRVSGTP